MKDIKKPGFMLEALRGRRGFTAILEILIAFAVFFVGSLVMGIGEVPLLTGYMLNNEEFMTLISDMSAGRIDTLTYYQQIQKIVADIPEWITISILYLEIFLILVVMIYCRYIEKRRLRTMGFQKKGMVSQYLLGVLGGTLFLSVAYLLCIVTGSIHFQGLAENIAPIYIIGYLGGYMIQGMAEEIMFRGYLFVSLSRRNSVMYSAVLSAILFSLLHGFNSGVSLLALINIFLFGFFAALLLVRYENIWIVGGFHTIWNFLQGNLYGIHVSGMSVESTVFVSENSSGINLISGGEFGMEGGLSVTLVFAVGIVWVLNSLKKEGKLVEWNGFRPVTNEYNNYLQNPNGQYGNGYPQNPNGQYGNGYPQNPNGQYGNGYPQSPNGKEQPENTYSQETTGQVSGDNPYSRSPGKMMPAQPGKRENMGTTPGQTPWHPENESQEPDNQFDANYFKE